MIRLAQSSPDFAYGFEDEVWWSRQAQPAMRTWCADEPARLLEKQVPKDDPDPKALACYGLYLPTDNQMLLRFVARRPVSAVTCTFLAWLAARFADQGKRALS